MKRNSIIQNIQNFNLSLIRLLLLFGVFSIISSCETEDDIPPESAYVEPEPEVPGEGCTDEVMVPDQTDLAEGIDFECGTPDTGFFGEAAGSITIEPADNPDKEGINTSDKVMMVTQTEGVEGWAGFFFDVTSKIDLSEKQTIKLKVYSPAAGQNINLKLEDSSDGTISKEVTMTSTVADEWEEISFAFSPSDSDKFDRMVLFFNFNGDKDATTVHYFDDIVLAEGGSTEEPVSDSEPTSTATDPNVDEDKVISLFSDVYTNVTVDTWRTEWSDATLEDITVNENNVKKYSDLNFVGIETVATPIDASAMSHFHVDIWTANATEFRIKLVDFGADGAFDGGDDVEHEIVISNPAQQEWVEVDISLSDFTGLTTKENIGQLIFAASPSGQNTIYIDNVYFYDSSGILNEPVSAAPTPTADAEVQSIFSDAYTNPTGVNYYPDWGQSTSFEIIDFGGNAVIKYGNVNYEGIDFGEAIDLTSYTTLKIDVWSADYTSIPIFLISTGSGERSVSLDVIPNQWNTLEIPLEDFISQGLDVSDIFQIKFDVQPDTGGSFFIDNLYFSNETGDGGTDGEGSAGTLGFPLDFDGSVDYASKTSGVAFEVVVNQNQSGINSTDTKVGAVTNNGQQYEALTVVLDEAIDFSGSNKTITMKVYSETAYPVLFKLETGVNGERANEVEVDHGGTGWEELTFDFANNAIKSYVDGDPDNGAAFVPVGQYDSFSIFLDFAGTTAGTFYIDDIEQN
ncbi:carbohydrate binding domain-containing protein [Zunongwangia sp. F260]|uniref:Carbohydrate binding domain-containing protein n=1 Tax=Autumnicola lenta TaxID=3075593 RepID=A0ABU3CLP8_9FLAO|nr:carbohydrate binding domain-containing protein [Zunongwangia sp. F260]MDT0647158.1 carbohydrate binding domain-containing protein [Zunongwangia sp. F260]